MCFLSTNFRWVVARFEDTFHLDAPLKYFHIKNILYLFFIYPLCLFIPKAICINHYSKFIIQHDVGKTTRKSILLHILVTVF